MNENEFISEFIAELDLHLEPCVVAHHKPLLYDLTVDDDGVIRMGVTDTGEPVRGHGKGFEQDILIYESRDLGTPVKPCAVAVVPRVVAEVKFNNVTTHDAIVYSEKARRIRTVYPYLRYGLILGGFQTIPGRVLRLGQGFDFIFAVSHPFIPNQIDSGRKALTEEVQTSRDLARIAFGRQHITSFRRRVLHDAGNA
ncbi:MAG TPA: hypothetical protein DC054_11660 [Blastocatellia bacterium]|nr:hypothetical protein [Blastocatellia bacterium]